MGGKKVDFYFSPPLVKEVSYEDVTRYPLVSDQVTLRLRHNYRWRDTEGPMVIVGVDTGGGPVKINGDEGIQIATLVTPAQPNRIVVYPTCSSQRVYNDELNLYIAGENFNQIGNTLRFANGILGNGVNYTTVATTNSMIFLRLTPGSVWKKQSLYSFPSPLTLLAVNAGEGFVAVGPNNAGQGRDIAMVFERPVVDSADTMYATRDSMLHIRGTGFPLISSGFYLQLQFSPPLADGVDYALAVESRTYLTLILMNGKTWHPTAGTLSVVGINTRGIGDPTGWITFPEPVQVANIYEALIQAHCEGYCKTQSKTDKYLQTFAVSSVENVCAALTSSHKTARVTSKLSSTSSSHIVARRAHSNCASSSHLIANNYCDTLTDSSCVTGLRHALRTLLSSTGRAKTYSLVNSEFELTTIAPFAISE
eukprot:gene24937-31335_t